MHRSKIELHNVDCLPFMKQCEDKQFDLAIVDPPYGIGYSGRDGQKTIKYDNKKKWDNETPTQEYFDELFRISKNQIIWGGNYFTDKLPISRCWICYDKKQPEFNSFGKFELAWASFDAIPLKFEFYPTHVTQGQRIHPTQKPIQLYKWLLDKYAKEGDKILDTHGGSMSIAIACHDYGFDLDICELDKDYFNQAIDRLNNHVKQQRLF